MTKNVTFNISQETIDKIDMVKNEYSISKNKLVEKAIQTYVDEERYLKKEKYVLIAEVVGDFCYDVTFFSNSLEEIEKKIEEYRDQYEDAFLNHYVYKVLEEK